MLKTISYLYPNLRPRSLNWMYLVCFARQATRCSYVRPVMVEEPILAIKGGRHPVLDELLGERFVPNDSEFGISHAPTTVTMI